MWFRPWYFFHIYETLNSNEFFFRLGSRIIKFKVNHKVNCVYVGELSNGQINGIGKLNFLNGESYVGNWENGALKENGYIAHISRFDNIHQTGCIKDGKVVLIKCK